MSIACVCVCVCVKHVFFLQFNKGRQVECHEAINAMVRKMVSQSESNRNYLDADCRRKKRRKFHYRRMLQSSKRAILR